MQIPRGDGSASHCTTGEANSLPLEISHAQVPASAPQRGRRGRSLWHPPRLAKEPILTAHHAMAQIVKTEWHDLQRWVDCRRISKWPDKDIAFETVSAFDRTTSGPCVEGRSGMLCDQQRLPDAQFALSWTVFRLDGARL